MTACGSRLPPPKAAPDPLPVRAPPLLERGREFRHYQPQKPTVRESGAGARCDLLLRRLQTAGSLPSCPQRCPRPAGPKHASSKHWSRPGLEHATAGEMGQVDLASRAVSGDGAQRFATAPVDMWSEPFPGTGWPPATTPRQTFRGRRQVRPLVACRNRVPHAALTLRQEPYPHAPTGHLPAQNRH